MSSAHVTWLEKSNNPGLTLPTEAPSSVRLRQSIVDSVEKDLMVEATARGMTLTEMRQYLLTSWFQTLTRREKCLRDRWLGMERSLPLLMTARRSPSPTTVFDLPPSLKRDS